MLLHDDFHTILYSKPPTSTKYELIDDSSSNQDFFIDGYRLYTALYQFSEDKLTKFVWNMEYDPIPSEKIEVLSHLSVCGECRLQLFFGGCRKVEGCRNLIWNSLCCATSLQQTPD